VGSGMGSAAKEKEEAKESTITEKIRSNFLKKKCTSFPGNEIDD
jgi:hypothetical protein